MYAVVISRVTAWEKLPLGVENSVAQADFCRLYVLG